MSPLSTSELIREIQRKLNITADGKPGPVTWSAIHAFVFDGPGRFDADTYPAPVSEVDLRSERVIATLHARVKYYARDLVHRAAAAGITIKIISGLRTYEEQDALYAKGRTAAGTRVTNARGGYSNHNFGIAFDVGIFDGEQYVPESPRYKAVAVMGLEIGLEWGGNWKGITDEPHFQLRPRWAASMPEGQMLAELRARKAAGKDFFAP